MRSANLKQILLLVLIFFFLFGDFFSLKKKIRNLFYIIKDFIYKNK